MMDATSSYRCKVIEGNTRGSLRLGRQRFKVDVVEMSQESFCVRVPSGIDRVDLELKQLDELTVPKLQKASFFGKANSVAIIGQTDPTLPVALLGAFIIAVLILPAWGGHWGTSQALCTAVSATWTALSELVASGR